MTISLNFTGVKTPVGCGKTPHSGERRLRRSSGNIPVAYSDECSFVVVAVEGYRCPPVSVPVTGAVQCFSIFFRTESTTFVCTTKKRLPPEAASSWMSIAYQYFSRLFRNACRCPSEALRKAVKVARTSSGMSCSRNLLYIAILSTSPATQVSRASLTSATG